MTTLQQVEADAKKVAAELGRDWSDCGAYERESFKDEARARSDGVRERLARIIHSSWSTEAFDRPCVSKVPNLRVQRVRNARVGRSGILMRRRVDG